MPTHSPHSRRGDPGASDGILMDACEGCEAHTKELGLSLDNETWMNMWDRMLDVEINHTRRAYSSRNEKKLGTQMYHMYIALQRYTTINPDTLSAPWRL